MRVRVDEPGCDDLSTRVDRARGGAGDGADARDAAVTHRHRAGERGPTGAIDDARVDNEKVERRGGLLRVGERQRTGREHQAKECACHRSSPGYQHLFITKARRPRRYTKTIWLS